MKLRNTFNMTYPALFVIPGYLLAVLLLLTSRFDWPALMIISIAGILSGIIAETIMIRSKADLAEHMKKVIISVAASAVFWLAASYFMNTQGQKLWGWGWWLTASGRAMKCAVQFAPAVITSVIWAITSKKPADKILLILTNPVTHITLWWHIINTLLSCLPT